jgi:prepilin-type N-terminal cleavage/methylation domain-containing protein
MKRHGYSLLEVIAVLLLIAVLALSAAVSLIPLSEGLVQARNNVNAAQKAALAMSRLSAEFTTITNVVGSGSGWLECDTLDAAGVARSRTVRWDGVPGQPLLLNDVPLSDDVQFFALRYLSRSGGAPVASWSIDHPVIEVVLQSRSGGTTYTNRIHPRNTGGG